MNTRNAPPPQDMVADKPDTPNIDIDLCTRLVGLEQFLRAEKMPNAADVVRDAIAALSAKPTSTELCLCFVNMHGYAGPCPVHDKPAKGGA